MPFAGNAITPGEPNMLMIHHPRLLPRERLTGRFALQFCPGVGSSALDFGCPPRFLVGVDVQVFPLTGRGETMRGALPD